MELPAPFGKYHLLEKVAVGGMAEVYLAKAFGAAGFERLLIIKKILPHMAEDDEFITMFIDEARIASTLNHSNIVQINELGKEDNDYFIAMEFVHGKDLSRIYDHLVSAKQKMPIPLAVLITTRVCEGLDYAHRKADSRGNSLSIIHRDVSPGNILISYDGGIKLIDFGIAKAQNRMGRTTAGTLKGKFGYMSPEQVRGMPLDHRTDIFSLGILLYEMLTGERLFGGESDFGTLEKVRNAIIAPPTTYNRKIPSDLEAIVMRALAREPEERYDWASDLQEDISKFLLEDGSLITTKSLAAFMRDIFAQKIADENERLAIFRRRGYPWVDAALEDDLSEDQSPIAEAEPESTIQNLEASSSTIILSSDTETSEPAPVPKPEAPVEVDEHQATMILPEAFEYDQEPDQESPT
ncbi:MAG: serine/threonine protein kinase, partial [Deltaproteobacteria bacterium]|nr:serine/threonine protein kinase [Deltaproteobacteria bacterium]